MAQHCSSLPTPRGAVTIRPATEADAPTYRDLRLEALHDCPEAFSSDYETYVAKPLSYWADRLKADQTVKLYFAAHEGQLVGMCGIAGADSPKTRHSAYIVSVYVRPDWRGLHIAEALIDACLGWGRAHGITIVKLGVAVTNIAAIRCYARSGFHVYGIEPQALYHDSVFYDELLMARRT
ncbi:MAG: GNAT family N-acetyltransferase [Anaerolineales bacterium]|nr:GNAT family N-acetyltransferase [Anaerolineales bacterium]